MTSPYGDTGLEQLTVLIVDENRHFRSVVRTLLHALKVNQTYEAADARAALAVLRDETIDLVLTGLIMEPVSGIKLAQAIRRAEGTAFQTVPIIGMTLHSSFDTIVKARDAGISEILAKPLSARQLERHMRVLLHHDRTFIRDEAFIGPDRRRHEGLSYAGPERRDDDAPIPQDAAETAS